MKKNTISIKDMYPGDVLLYRGTSKLDDFIIKVDGGQYNHGAIYAGERKVIHALGFRRVHPEKTIVDDTNHLNLDVEPEQHTELHTFTDWIRKKLEHMLDTILKYPREFNGVFEQDIETTCKDQKFVGVFRFCKDGHFLGSSEYPSDPVLSILHKYLKENPDFAYDHALFGILLVLTRQIKLTPWLRLHLRIILDHLVQFIENLILLDKDRTGCTELVDRCFLEAAPDNKYTLDITGEPLDKRILKTIHNMYIDHNGKVTIPSDERKEIEHSLAKLIDYWCLKYHRNIPSVVSPIDLETSPTLKFQGLLKW